MPKKASATKASSKKAASGPTDEAVIALALVALNEVTIPETFSQDATVTRGEDTLTVAFPSTQPGYPGWKWSVSVSSAPGIEPTVLELGLVPGEGALVAPDWVPWADRLEEYLLHEQELKAQEAEDEDDGEDALEIDDDVDGVDIDQLDLELDPAPLEVPDEPDDLFDHVELEEPDPLDP